VRTRKKEEANGRSEGAGVCEVEAVGVDKPKVVGWSEQKSEDEKDKCRYSRLAGCRMVGRNAQT